MVDTEFLSTVFVIGGVILFLLTQNLWFNTESILTKIGSAASIIGVFVGTFIAVWLINRDHIKRIAENNHYKVSLLVNLVGISNSVVMTLTFFQADRENQEENSRVVEAQIKNYEYWAHLIEQINTNIMVPAEIRTSVAHLLHQGIKPISFVNIGGYDSSFLHVTFLGPLNSIIESDYIAKDNDSEVQHFLKMVQKNREMLENIAKKDQT